IEEEVYVCQPPGFEDPDFPDRVYKVEKALYGLHQAPRAWYETLSTYLLDNGFQRGKIDKTLFIKRHKGDILLVQVYVDDIIFGLTKKELCNIFEKLMHEKFLMSSMKFRFIEVKTASTPMETQKPLLKDEDGKEVDVHMYRSMIGSLMYLTSLRPGIIFAVYSPFDLVAYTNSEFAGASLDMKSTIGEAEYVAALSCCGQVLWIQNQLLDYRVLYELVLLFMSLKVSALCLILLGKAKKSVKLMMEKLFKMELELMLVPQPSDPSDNVADKAVHKELGDSLVRAATTASSLEAERVKKLENKRSSRTHKLKRLYKVGLSARVESSNEESLGEDASKQGRINAIDSDEDTTLVNVQDDADNEMFDVNALNGDEVFAEQEVAAKDVNLTIDEVSAATTTTATIPTPRKGIIITELGTPIITRSSQQPSQAKVQDKGKGKMIEPEHVKKMSKKDQLRSDEAEAKRLQAEFDEEERLAREKDEDNVALTEERDDIQAKIEANHDMAQRT
ncbi:putative ribonuclease H-like domain-containing protein, partial [Tanacetum coccineum]